MSDQLKAATVRAALGAILAFGATFFATIPQVEDDCNARRPPLKKSCEPGTDTKEKKAVYAGAAAAIAYLAARGGYEGIYDTKRQNDGTVKPGDVTPPPGG